MGFFKASIPKRQQFKICDKEEQKNEMGLSVDLLSDNSLEEKRGRIIMRYRWFSKRWETLTDISSNVFHSKLFQVSQANS